jgi:hypothetical protein
MVIGVASDRQLNFEFLIVLSIIWKTNRRNPQKEVIFMSSKPGGLHEKHAVATWNLETISSFA